MRHVGEPNMEIGTPRLPVQGYLYKKSWVVALLCGIDTILGWIPQKKRRPPQTVKSILLIRPDHLGDMLMTSGIVALLRRMFPNAHIDCLCGSWCLSLAEDMGCFDQTIIVDHWMLNRSRASVWHKVFTFVTSYILAWKHIRNKRYDTCLCLRPFGGNLISLAALSRANFVVGHGTAGGGRLLDVCVPWIPGEHAVAQMLRLVASCGKTPISAPPVYEPLRAGNGKQVEDVLMKLGLCGEYHVFIPGSGDKAKMMPPEFWHKLAASIKQGQIAICGAAVEKILVPPIAGNDQRFVDATGLFAFREYVLFLSKASSIHSVDSFGAHLAALSGRPVHVYFKPWADIAAWHPLGDNCFSHVVYDDAIRP